MIGDDTIIFLAFVVYQYDVQPTLARIDKLLYKEELVLFCDYCWRSSVVGWLAGAIIQQYHEYTGGHSQRNNPYTDPTLIDEKS